MAAVWYFSQPLIDVGGVGSRHSNHNRGSLKTGNEIPARDVVERGQRGIHTYVNVIGENS